MSSEIPQIPQPVPFTFHRGKDKTYTTVYQAVDFPLDHFAIFKQNPVNRDRITEANKMLYSLQKQINELREALIALAITVDENVEKKVTLSVKIGNEAKDIEGTLLKDEYKFTITGVEFGDQESITATAQIDESNYIEVESEYECVEGANVEVKGKAKEVKEGEPPVITIKKSTGPTENSIEVTGTSATKTFTSDDTGKIFVFKSGETYYTATKMQPAGGEEVTIEGTTFTVDEGKEYTFTVEEAQEKKEYTVTVNSSNSP